MKKHHNRKYSIPVFILVISLLCSICYTGCSGSGAGQNNSVAETEIKSFSAENSEKEKDAPVSSSNRGSGLSSVADLGNSLASSNKAPDNHSSKVDETEAVDHDVEDPEDNDYIVDDSDNSEDVSYDESYDYEEPEDDYESIDYEEPEEEETYIEDDEPEEEYYEDDESDMVWISRTGTKYHSNPDCSNMKNPGYVTLDEAIAQGRTPCKKCY